MAKSCVKHCFYNMFISCVLQLKSLGLIFSYPVIKGLLIVILLYLYLCIAASSFFSPGTIHTQMFLNPPTFQLDFILYFKFGIAISRICNFDYGTCTFSFTPDWSSSSQY